MICFLKYFVLKDFRSLLFKFNNSFGQFFSLKQISVAVLLYNNFSSSQKVHFWSKLGKNYQFVVRFIFVMNGRISYFKVCSVHYKICVLQKFIMSSFFICLKFICQKIRENLNLSQGNQGKVRKFLHQTWLATLKVLCYLKFNAKYV